MTPPSSWRGRRAVSCSQAASSVSRARAACHSARSRASAARSSGRHTIRPALSSLIAAFTWAADPARGQEQGDEDMAPDYRADAADTLAR